MLNNGPFTRTCDAAAPPRYPVSRTAPKIEVRGTMYRIVQISSTTPIPTIDDSGNPNCTVDSTTTRGLNNFIPPSISRKRVARPVRMRPDQRRLPEISFGTLVAWVIACALMLCVLLTNT